jgi:hypothetical protein
MASTTTRALPARPNPQMTSEERVPEYSVILKRRNLGQTPLKSLGTADSNEARDMVFDYLHLRVPIPKGIVSGVFKSSSSSYFLMRRSSDGFISATGMFKAAFPWASIAEHEAETKYFRDLPGTSPDETAGNVWITPAQALRLADEYHISLWVRALLDPARITGERNSTIKQPPKFNLAGYDEQQQEAEEEEVVEKPKSQLEADKPRLAPPTPPSSFHRPTRARRSASPTKASRRKEVPPPSPRKRSSARIRAQSKEPREPSEEPPNVRDDASVSDMASTADPDEGARETSLAPHDMPIATIEEEEDPTVEVKTTATATATANIVAADEEEEIQATVHVDEEIRIDAATGEEIKHTKVELEVPLPTAGVPMSQEEMREMLEEARAMVESRSEEDDEEDEVPVRSARDTKPKRKAEDISKGDDEEEVEGKDQEPAARGEEVREEHRAKRARTEAAAAVQVKKRRVRNRALFGIGATVAVGALIPWALNFL